MSPEDLPDVHEAVLDEGTLEELFRDVELSAELISVNAKGAPTERAEEDELSLDTARRRLVAGDVRGIQIRYRFEGAQWWDTLMRLPNGFRLVRIRHDFRGA